MRKIFFCFILVMFSLCVSLEGGSLYVTTTEDGVPGSLRAAICSAVAGGGDAIIYYPSRHSKKGG
ncbi:MAG: hypothetical protein GY765_41115 [bacterium]|nr:hypothetical protein [bacterium]